MQITINVPDNIVSVLGRWSSVQPIFTEAIDLVDRTQSLDVVVAERVERNVEELKEVGPALESLHRIVHAALKTQNEEVL